MAIIYTTRKRAQPGVKGGGNMKYYADIVIQGVDKIDDFIKDIEKSTSLTEPDVVGVLSAVKYQIKKRLACSRIVKFDDLLTIYPYIHSTGSDIESDVKVSNIISTDIRITSDRKLVEYLQEVPYEKAKKITYL